MTGYLLDDEPLAIGRLRGLLEGAAIDVVGSSSNPVAAVDEIRQLRPDVLFLDVEMPGLSGFDVLERIEPASPLVIFTTAYSEHALRAFEVDSIDYLVKPVEQAALDRALAKLSRLSPGLAAQGGFRTLVDRLRELLDEREPGGLTKVASRTGDRVQLVRVADVTYFYARDKLTFAVTASKHHALDLSLSELEARLAPRQWIRIHRATLLNLDAVKELRKWFGGKLLVLLKDGSELQVARDRVAELKAKLALE
jgi:two-component system LytT family response regulator